MARSKLPGVGWFVRGTGPGTITADGCAVELYAQLPAGAEPELIDRAIPVGAGILELGAGAGRITHPLLRRGHSVVAVDASAEMLAHIRGARTVTAAIETLDLVESFDVVLLGSHLINTPNARLRAAFLDCCRRHVRDGGCVLLERHAPGWFDTATGLTQTAGGITYRLHSLRQPADGVLEASMDYTVGDQRWTHTFRTERVTDTHLATLLPAHGLAAWEQLTDDGTWISATPATRTDQDPDA